MLTTVLATHPGTPAPVLGALTTHAITAGDPVLSRALATNPTLPAAQADRLATWAMGPSGPGRLLERVTTYEALVARPGTDLQVVAEAVHGACTDRTHGSDATFDLVTAVLGVLGAPFALALAHLGPTDRGVTQALAIHPDTPPEVAADALRVASTWDAQSNWAVWAERILVTAARAPHLAPELLGLLSSRNDQWPVVRALADAHRTGQLPKRATPAWVAHRDVDADLIADLAGNDFNTWLTVLDHSWWRTDVAAAALPRVEADIAIKIATDDRYTPDLRRAAVASAAATPDGRAGIQARSNRLRDLVPGADLPWLTMFVPLSEGAACTHTLLARPDLTADALATLRSVCSPHHNLLVSALERAMALALATHPNATPDQRRDGHTLATGLLPQLPAGETTRRREVLELCTLTALGVRLADGEPAAAVGSDVPVHALRVMTGQPGLRHLASAALDDVAPTMTTGTALILAALEPRFPGTIGELIATASAVAT